MKELVLAIACLLCYGGDSARAANVTLTVSTFGAISPSIIISSNPATGINCGSTNTACTASFSTGSVIVLTELNSSTTVFVGWTGAQGCGSNQRTCRFTITANSAVSATFDPILRIGLSGVGLGAITDSSGAVNCTSINGCLGNGSQTYHAPTGTQIVLHEAAGSSSTFTGWTGSGGCATASTCTITLNGYMNIVATFTSVGPFTIKVAVPNGGGRVRSSPSGIDCGTNCTASFSSGTVISLTTSAASGYYFGGWSNGGCSGKNPCVITASSTYQGLGGRQSPGAFFYPNP